MVEIKPPAMSDELLRVLRIPLEAMVVLAEKEMTLREVLGLRPGTIVEFEKSIVTPFDLVINNRRVANGIAVKVGENFGIKVSAVQPVEKTVKALAGQ